MATVPVTLRGVLYNGMGPIGPYEVGQEVTIVAVANITGLGVGGGPMPGGPPLQIGGGPMPGGLPPHIWGGPMPPGFATPPIAPGGPVAPPGGYPIFTPLPPDITPPPPGSPPIMVPGTQPVQPMVPPPAIVVDYPGIGKVIVPQPLPPAPPPTA